MGVYSEYLEKFAKDWSGLEKERKKQLLQISELRDHRAILVIAAAISKPGPTGIDYDDRLRIFDQISNLEGNKIDIILETGGGLAEVAEDIIRHIRNRFSHVAMIIPGYAKSVGTIMTMAGDEILMDPSSALGPIDAQILQQGKRFSAQAFLDGLEKIKQQVLDEGYLNRAYVPILQNISPGEIQNCENTLEFGKELVTRWLSEYKFKFWDRHSSTEKPVTQEEKEERAKSIANDLCNHSKWLSHARSIYIDDLREMRLKITDYSKNIKLCDAIQRYFILLRMSFDNTNIIKICETPKSQIYFHTVTQQTSLPKGRSIIGDNVIIEFVCPNCGNMAEIQANFRKGIQMKKGAVPFPDDNIFICPKCKNRNDISSIRGQIESQLKKKVL
jgi:predicted RNA-binding Zn-ribbon protein involved in translation (DUF1610 family)